MFIVSNGRLQTTHEFLPTPENALDLSIAKWEFILNYLETVGIPLQDGANETCGLCCAYYICVSCLVRHAGYKGCMDTPYEDYLDAETLEEHITAAKAEITFLKGLRK